MEAVGVLNRELRRGGLALAGVTPTLEALKRGQVDVLVIAEAFAPPSGWSCRRCGTVEVSKGGRKAAAVCPECGGRSIREVDLRETMVRLAEEKGSFVEVVHQSDVLVNVGGVGCLLRYLTPEQRI